jgi:hypothetical protein
MEGEITIAVKKELAKGGKLNRLDKSEPIRSGNRRYFGKRG